MFEQHQKYVFIIFLFLVIIIAYTQKRYNVSKNNETTHGIRQLENNEWMPLVFDKCVPGMKNFSAPCLIKPTETSNLIYAQEIIYSPFMLSVPGFVTELDKIHWLERVSTFDRFRLSNDKKWALYPTQYGQNLIFKHAIYSGNPVPDKWGESSCVAPKTTHSQFLKSSINPRLPVNNIDDYVIIATSPDSWSMQHCQDRVLPLYIHAQLAIPISINPVLLTGRHPEQSTLSLYDKFGINKRIHYTLGSYPIQAKYLVFPCRMPLIHPWTHMEVSKKLGWLSYELPITKRLDVVWLGRKANDRHQLNKGRQLINEDEFLNDLKSLLIKRNLGEKLVLFDPDIHGIIGNSSKYMAQNVRAVLGVHGAKFYNARYCAKGTFILEIYQKVDSYCPCFWEQSRLSYQNHYIHFAEPEDSTNVNFSNMVIKNIPAIMETINENLGKAYDPNEALKHQYVWNVA